MSRHHLCTLLALLAIHYCGPAFSIDPCQEDLSALYRLPDGVKLEGDALRTVIERLAHFELNEIQNSAKPPSAVAQMKQDLQTKISVAAERASLPEEKIRQQIALAKQRIVFGNVRPKHPNAQGEALKRELKQIGPLQPLFHPTARLPTHTTIGLALSPDGKHLLTRISGPGDGEVEVWNLEENPPRKMKTATVPDPSGTIFAFTWGAEGTPLLAVAEKSVHILDPNTAEQRGEIQLAEEYEYFQSASITRDGTRLATGTNMNEILIWNVDSRRIEQTLRIGTGATRTLITQMDPDGQWVLSVAGGSGAKLWQVEKGIRKFEPTRMWPRVTAAAILPGGNELLTCSDRGEISIQNLSGSGDAHVIGNYGERVSWLALSADGKLAAGRLTSHEADSAIRIFDLQKRRMLQRIPVDRSTISQNVPTLSINANRMASKNADGTVQIWSSKLDTLPD